MSLILLDSFDHYNIPTEKWTAAGGASIDLTNSRGRTGIGACICVGEGPSLTFTALPGCVMGSGYNTQSLEGDILGVISGTIRQVRLKVESNGAVSVLSGNDPLPNLLGTSDANLVIPGSYSYWEMKISEFSATGNVIIRRNGLIVLNIIGNTNPDGTGTCTQWYLCGPSASSSAAQDDSYLCDLVDSGIPTQPNNDFLGPIHIYALPPTADATPLQWTPSSGTTHFNLVAEIPPDDDGSFVSDSTVGNVDQYTYDTKSIPQPSRIIGVQLSLDSKVDSLSGGRQIAPDVSGQVGTPASLTATYNMVRQAYDGNPVNLEPWQISDFVVTRFGPKVTGPAAGGLYVAVAFGASSTDQVMTSPDAVTWTGRSTSFDGSTNGATLALSPGGGIFVVIGTTGTNTLAAAISTDHGVTWTPHGIPSTGADPVADYYSAGIYRAGLYIAVAFASPSLSPVFTVITSSDGITWTAGSLTAFAGSGTSGIAFGAGLYVVTISGETTGQFGNNIVTSPDGISWTLRNIGFSGSLDDVCYGGGQFVAISGSSAIALPPLAATSPDGITWTQQTVPNQLWNSVAYGAGLYVAVAIDTSGTIITSPDGVTWTSHSVPAAINAFRVRFLGGQFVVTLFDVPGETGQVILTSPDGLTWTQQTGAVSGLCWNVGFSA